MTIIENFNKEETYGVSANTLVHGDCLEVMKCIKDKSVDMILCDPLRMVELELLLVSGIQLFLLIKCGNS